MIAILNGADFSENNVGRITIPVELSDWTLATIAMYANYPWNDEKRNALEMFYRSLVTEGIMEKMEYLAFPILATTFNEAINNTIAQGQNITNVGQSDKYEVIVGKGISRIAAINKPDDLAYASPERDSFLSEFHIAFCTTTSVPDNGSVYSNTVAKNLESQNSSILALNQCVFGFGSSTLSMGFRGLVDRGDMNKTQFFNINPYMFPGVNPNLVPPLRVLKSDKNFANIPTTFVGYATNDTCGFSIGEQQIVSESLVPDDPESTNATKIAFRPNYENKDNPLKRRVYINLQPFIIDDQWFCQKFGILSFGYPLNDTQNISYQKAISQLVDAVKIN